MQFAQGILFKTWKERFGIKAALVNGGGNNRTDDNTSLDVILGGEAHISDWLRCRGSTQFSQQPDGWRSAGIISVDLYLRKRLTTIVNLAYHKERDIRSNGWYIRCLYDLTKKFV